MNSSQFHDQAYEFYSFEVLGQDIFKLAKELLEDGQEFDRIVALAKGGLTFARSLVDFLDVESVSSIQIEMYTGIGTTHHTPVITQSLPVSIRNERILVFDDIVDKGDTMKLAAAYLEQHGPKSITTAALITKPWSNFKVDYSARSSEAWVIFQNEIRETIVTLEEMWSKAGDSPQQISKQLLEVGFSQEEVDLFAKAK